VCALSGLVEGRKRRVESVRGAME